MRISDLLDKDILKEEEEHSKRERSGKFNPSAFGQCYRRQIYNRRNTPKSDPINIESLRILRAGKVFHRMIEEFLPEHQVEVLVEEDDVKGFADIVMEDEVSDIKSQKEWAFKAMDKDGFDLLVEKVDHLLQVCYYAMRLGKKWARMVYVNKDTLEIREFSILVSDMVKRVEDEIKVLREWWAKGELPPAEPRLYKGKECKYCSWETTCKGKDF